MRHPPVTTRGPRPSPRASHQRGLSLVEIMVGLVLGMLSVLVVLQMFQQSDGAKRSALGGDDAQNSGALALTLLQRDLRQSGHGVAAFPIAGCDVTLPGGLTLGELAPVTINHADIPAGDAGTDTLLVVYGTSAGAPEGSRIINQPATGTYGVAAPASFAIGDRVLASPAARPAPCTLVMTTVTAVVSPSPPNVSVATGVAGMTNGRLYNLGPAPRMLAYAVRTQQLTQCDMLAADCTDAALADDPTVWVPVGNQIVALRAQYGRDTSGPPMDAVVDVFDQTAPANACDWMRVSALRIVVVARSAHQEREAVTAASAPTWAGAASAPIDLSDLDDWENFRYRSFETLVPLRNMTWLGGTAGC
jgi:type IV pilus assembly protein PilW